MIKPIQKPKPKVKAKKIDYVKGFIKYCEENNISLKGCQLCGNINSIFDIHHIVFKSETLNPERDSPINLIYVCRSCHETLHGNKREARRQLVIDRGLEKIFNKKLL